jgi:hypothetical protein
MGGQFVDIQVNQWQMMSLERLLRDVPRGVNRVLSRAINKTLTTLRSRLVKSVSAASSVKQKTLRGDVQIQKATLGSLWGRLRLRGKGIPLRDMEPRQTAIGVSVRGKHGSRFEISHAFIATMPSGHIGVWKRVRTSRLPIRELFGASIQGIWFREHVIESQTISEGRQLLEHYINQEVGRILEGGTGAGWVQNWRSLASATAPVPYA